MKKLKEEIKEFNAAIKNRSHDKIEEEFGDVLFSLVNYARFLQVDAEGVLEKTNKKFISRFQQMESIALTKGKNLADLTLGEMDAIWNEVKKQTQAT